VTFKIDPGANKARHVSREKIKKRGKEKINCYTGRAGERARYGIKPSPILANIIRAFKFQERASIN